MTASQVVVGMSEIQVLKGSGTFCCLGLGSCIGLAVLDPVSHVAGMVHIMLPESFPGKPIPQKGKFADTGVPSLLEEVMAAGARKERLVVALAGGAQVFSFGSGTTKLDIGARNSVAVNQLLAIHKLKVIAADTGGNLGRTVTFVVETGEIRVKTVTQGERKLCNLRG